ncbi:HPr family phosphocarrier protein [Paenarthrobacter sp. Z7-10]|uniref:HPr family phosphocarrier protein n=1 Tax=Paenarthrobacter sp. Z7-10 TaxID=2787635 RepID=UPI0022A9C0CA|nr:HPr family phosphocarrier protein [Paenarthrobacter sp. Z7-10]MCZ2401749.1 HPr family phosphocarrier protein [Paenarthrobacter sp. Z7-10]
MSERRATIASRVGLHLRPAALFAEAAARLPVEVTIARDGAPVQDALNAASVLAVLSLGAECGDVVVLRAEGADADVALASLAAFLERDLDAE